MRLFVSFLLSFALMFATPSQVFAQPTGSYFTLKTEAGALQYSLKSPNPDQPVVYTVNGKEVGTEYNGYLDNHVYKETSVQVLTTPSNPVKTTPDENPIKLDVASITADQGEFTGNSVVLYGFYLQPDGKDLGFYINQKQSMNNFVPGEAGLSVGFDKDDTGDFIITIGDKR